MEGSLSTVSVGDIKGTWVQVLGKGEQRGVWNEDVRKYVVLRCIDAYAKCAAKQCSKAASPISTLNSGRAGLSLIHAHLQRRTTSSGPLQNLEVHRRQEPSRPCALWIRL